MSFEQVIYMIKHKNLNNLLPVTAIRTITDRDVYLENDYNTLPIGLLQEQYPELPDKIIEHLYYEPNSFEGILYYDLHAMTLFHTLLNISENKFITLLLLTGFLPRISYRHFQKNCRYCPLLQN